MKPFRERNPVTIAIVGTAVIVALLALAFNARRLPFIGEGPTYYADFTNASGLAPGEEVRIAGIKVGTVSSVDIEGGHVRIGFHVKGAGFGTATAASIEIKSLLGEHYLSLHPAGPGQLATGATIPLGRTTTPFNVEPAFGKLATTVGAINTNALATSFATLANTFRSTAPDVRQTLRGLSRLSTTIASRDQQIHDLIAHTDAVSGTVAARDQQITSLITATNQVLTALNQRRDAIHQLLTGATALSHQLIGLVDDNKKQLHPALVQLHSVTTILRDDDAQIGSILKQAAPFARLFVNVVGSGRWFDSTVKVPRGLAACDDPTADPLASLIDPILSAANKAINGSSTPCLPLGPAPGSNS